MKKFTPVMTAIILAVGFHLGGAGIVQAQSSALIGQWAWDYNELWQYTFNANGTGVRGLPDENETFRWSNPAAGRLDIVVGRVTERWDYAIRGNMLTITSRQVAGMTYSYMRFDPAIGTIVMPAPPRNHPLIGQWAWDDNALWQYTFNADGTGVRGFPDERETFRWTIPETGRLDIRVGGATERWDFAITGNVFSITSRQVAGMMFSYRRVN